MPHPIVIPRAELAKRVIERRIERFGSKSAAYHAAGVSAPTWDRIEAGESVRQDRLISAVRTLWPASRGDWEAIDTPEEDGHQDLPAAGPIKASRTSTSALASYSDDDLLMELAYRLDRNRHELALARHRSAGTQ